MTPVLPRFLATFRIAAVLAGLGMLVAAPGTARAAADTPIRLVFAAELAPLSFEESGRTTGLLIDIAREVFVKRLGERMVADLYPWERAQQMVRAGEADGFITIATAARTDYAHCGRIPVLRAPLHPLIRRDHPSREDIEAATSLEDLRRFNVVSYFGNGWAKENLQGFNVYYAVDFQASMRGLAQGRGDLAFVTTTSGSYYLHEFDLEEKLAMLPLVVDTFEYVLCLGKQSSHAARLAEFDRVLEVMRTDGAYRPLLGRYGMKADAFY